MPGDKIHNLPAGALLTPAAVRRAVLFNPLNKNFKKKVWVTTFFIWKLFLIAK